MNCLANRDLGSRLRVWSLEDITMANIDLKYLQFTFADDEPADPGFGFRLPSVSPVIAGRGEFHPWVSIWGIPSMGVWGIPCNEVPFHFRAEISTPAFLSRALPSGISICIFPSADYSSTKHAKTLDPCKEMHARKSMRANLCNKIQAQTCLRRNLRDEIQARTCLRRNPRDKFPGPLTFLGSVYPLLEFNYITRCSGHSVVVMLSTSGVDVQFLAWISMQEVDFQFPARIFLFIRYNGISPCVERWGEFSVWTVREVPCAEGSAWFSVDGKFYKFYAGICVHEYSSTDLPIVRSIQAYAWMEGRAWICICHHFRHHPPSSAIIRQSAIMAVSPGIASVGVSTATDLECFWDDHESILYLFDRIIKLGSDRHNHQPQLLYRTIRLNVQDEGVPRGPLHYTDPAHSTRFTTCRITSANPDEPPRPTSANLSRHRTSRPRGHQNVVNGSEEIDGLEPTPLILDSASARLRPNSAKPKRTGIFARLMGVLFAVVARKDKAGALPVFERPRTTFNMISQILLPIATTLLCYVLFHVVQIVYRDFTSPLRHV
ncbi:hypothetical protein C8R44DRAFT_855363, partial [Mycena epipterygia]